jgi:DNA-binding CsgD family transcriptional regulator
MDAHAGDGGPWNPRATLVDPVDIDARTLAAALVSCVLSDTTHDQHHMRSPAGPDVILDVEVQGVRCVLSLVPQRPVTAPRLSRRQFEIATMIADGLTNREIASTLQISEWTVATHIRHVFAKFGVSTRAAMVARMLA